MENHAALFLAAVLFATVASGADPEVAISDAKKDDHGFLNHDIQSPYQAEKTQLRILLPDERKADQRFPVIYVLPVEAKNENRYGDGLLEVSKGGLHNKHQAIFAAPTFSHLPWYADHPTNPAMRQETYLLKVVLPFVEKTYPAARQRQGRLLLGFSKSGWGAWSLLLRNPDVFGRAAAWDAPLLMDRSGKYGSGEIFGTQENFDGYRISDLLRTRSKDLGGEQRLILTGYGSFPDHRAIHERLLDLKIAHSYLDGPQRKHDWHSGWVSESVGLLLSK